MDDPSKGRNARVAWFALLLAVIGLSVALASCRGLAECDPSVTPITDGRLDYDKLCGNIDVDGSSTVYPISQAMAEEFSIESNVRVNVALSGTGGGFEKFCRGDIQISNASRPIRESEVEECAANGIDDIVELQVAIDALTIVINPDNDWAECMTLEQVVDVFRADGARRWSELDPSWPDQRIITYYPGADSGTFDYFTEVLHELDESYVHTSDGTSSEDDNVLIIGVEGDRNAIGYFGLAYYVEAGQHLKGVAIDNGDGCVEPSAETARSGEYEPFSRPLFLYTRASFLEDRPEILGFIKFYYEIMDEIVPETGYASLSEEQKAQEYAKFALYLPGRETRVRDGLAGNAPWR